MKTLLRACGLMALLALTTLAAGRAVVSGYGNCRTVCYAPIGTTPYTTTVIWQTTQADCCDGVVNPPCPAGYRAGYSAFQPGTGGSYSLCPPVYN